MTIIRSLGIDLLVGHEFVAHGPGCGGLVRVRHVHVLQHLGKHGGAHVLQVLDIAAEEVDRLVVRHVHQQLPRPDRGLVNTRLEFEVL